MKSSPKASSWWKSSSVSFKFNSMGEAEYEINRGLSRQRSYDFVIGIQTGVLMFLGT